MTFEKAAPSTEGSQYALSFIRAAKIQSGQEVLVYGATGAIGAAVVQLLKSLAVSCGSSETILVPFLLATFFHADERPLGALKPVAGVSQGADDSGRG